MDKGYPLVLVFYLDREMMMVPEIIRPYTEAVNNAIAKREANAIAFFLPTDGEERIECINPTIVDEADMERVNKMIDDIAKNFDVGQGADDGKNDPESTVETSEDDEE